MNNNKFLTIEQSFVIIKPDAILRGLVGKIIKKFEEQGLKLVAARMIQATKEQAAAHYPGQDKAWLSNLGDKTADGYKNDLKAMKNDLGTSDKLEIGKMIYKSMVDYICNGPIIIMVWEGNHAIDSIRRIVGKTLPYMAEVGSIRGSYGFDTPSLATRTGRITFKTLVHASDSESEAKREIKVWFGEKFKDLSDYERVDYIDIF